MSILIKDTKLSDADLCPLDIHILSDGTVCDGEWGYVVADAIELSSHGRLIDADQLGTGITNLYAEGKIDANTVASLLGLILQMPTIVEEEE